MAKPFTHNCHGCGNGIPHDAEATGKTVSCPYCAVETELGKIYPTSEMSRANPWDESEEASPEQTAEITAQAYQSPPPLPRKDPDSTADVGESEQSIRGRSVLKREQPVKANTEGGSLLFLRGFLLTLLGVAAGFVLGFDYQNSISPAVTNPNSGELNPVIMAYNVFVGCCGAAIGGVIGILSHLVWKEFTKQDKAGGGIAISLSAIIVIAVMIAGVIFSTQFEFKGRSGANPVRVAELEPADSKKETNPNLGPKTQTGSSSTSKPAKGPQLPAPSTRSLEQWRSILKQQGGDPSKLYFRAERLCYDELDGKDLAPLKGIPLNSLHFVGSQFTNLNPVLGMPLDNVNLHASPNLSDLTPLVQLPLRRLVIDRCRLIRDFSVLAKLDLESLDLKDTDISDLSGLEDLKLKYLRLEGCRQLESLAPLKRMTTLETLLPPKSVPGLEALRSLPNLKVIGYTEESLKAPLEFWREFDATR